MLVEFVTTTSDLIDQLPIKNGQIIALYDEDGYYYDMNDTRYRASGVASLAKLGLVKPDGTTITVDSNGVISASAESGGHTIQNPAGVDLAQEDTLQFIDAGVSDDSTHEKTKVEIMRQITSSDLSSLTQDGLYETTDEPDGLVDASLIAYGSGTVADALDNMGSGHIIENPAGTDMAQRANMQFVDSHLADDSTTDRTKIESIKDITSADYANATEDGFYNVTDESDEELTAADIAYDSNDSIKEKIDAVLSVATGADSVEVTADGVKSVSELLNTLYGLIDLTKITTKSNFEIQASATNIIVLHISRITDTYLEFSRSYSENEATILQVKLSASGSRQGYVRFTSAPAISFTNESANIATSGIKYVVRY